MRFRRATRESEAWARRLEYEHPEAAKVEREKAEVFAAALKQAEREYREKWGEDPP